MHSSYERLDSTLARSSSPPRDIHGNELPWSIGIASFLKIEFPEHEPTLPALVPDQDVDRDAITWDDLIQREPRLADLLEEAEAVRDEGRTGFCAMTAFYRHIRPPMLTLVGWEAERDDRVLLTSRAYDLAARRLLDALPPCRNCWCI